MDINKFLRIEEKYLLTKEEKKELLKRIDEYLKKDRFYKSSIYNIYYDTKNNDLIINSLEKPIFKDKFRIRSYDLKSDDVFLEIKTKYKGVVGKRRVKIKYSKLEEYLNKDTDNQILKEIKYYFEFYNLIPKIYIAYDRLSYRGKYDNDLRITFDSNLRSRRDNLVFEDKNTLAYFKEKTYIMEIKTVGSMPKWLVDVLSDMKIFPTSFSKYGKIYEREMINYA